MAQTAKQRQAKKRAREAQHRIDVGATLHKFETYRATEEALDRIKTFSDIEDMEEVFSTLIHNIDRLIITEPHFARYLLDISRLRGDL